MMFDAIPPLLLLALGCAFHFSYLLLFHVLEARIQKRVLLQTNALAAAVMLAGCLLAWDADTGNRVCFFCSHIRRGTTLEFGVTSS